MPMELELCFRVTVETPEEAERLQNAVYSGLAADLLRMGVLYGQLPLGGVAPLASSGGASLSIEQREARKRASEIELKRVETKVTKPIDTSVPEPEIKRPVGLAGRRRLGRK